MRKKFSARAAALGMSGVLLTSALTGCTFGFASDPDDPNAVKEEVPIDMTTDTFQYDTSLSGTSIVIMNTKAEIQTALEEIAKVFEEKAGVHIEIMPVPDGDSPYTKVVSLYNSGNPPTLSILDTTDVIALAEEKAADLSNEAWTGEAEEYLTKINRKVYSFPLCIEGRGIIYNKSVIEDTLGTEFDPSNIKTQDDFAALLQNLRDNGMKNPISMAKEDWSLGAHQLQYIYETYNGTSDGAAEVINELKDGTLYLPDYTRMNEFLNTFDLLKEYNVAKGDPLGADYDEMAIDLADGKTAFWFNGNWAWAEISDYIEDDTEIGIMPVPQNGTEENANVNDYICGGATKQVMIDKECNDEKQQAAAKDFLDWLANTAEGNKVLVDDCSLVPAFSNITEEATNMLGQSIQRYTVEGKLFDQPSNYPGDHWSEVGAIMQKYLDKQIDRAEFAKEVQDYWTNLSE